MPNKPTRFKVWLSRLSQKLNAFLDFMESPAKAKED